MPRPRAIVFDLDEVLIDSAPAWLYALEESMVSVTGRRENLKPLVAEYRRRPLRDVLAMLLATPAERDRAEKLFTTMYGRSAMKKLLVHQHVGMSLDQLRSLRIEMAAITRLPHYMAMRQIESTGLDRFFSVMSPTAPDPTWDPVSRTKDCLGYLEYAAAACLFVSGEGRDLGEVKALGLTCYEARWAAVESTGFPALESMEQVTSAGTA
jgi:phosphoglycolate phosphatase-like HAD superfamily hydrolase